MADKLLIVMMNSDPHSAVQVVPVLSQATVAAAMEFEVEVVLTGRAAGLAQPGIAEKILLKPDSARTVYDVIKEMCETGVKLKVCAMGLEYWGDEVIPEVEETVGGAYIISEAMDDETVTFTY